MHSCTNITVKASSVFVLSVNVCTGTWYCRKKKSPAEPKKLQSRLAGGGEIRMWKLKRPLFFGGAAFRMTTKFQMAPAMYCPYLSHRSCRLPKKTTYNQGSTHSHKNQLSSLSNFTSFKRQLIPHLTEPLEEEVAPADQNVGNGSSSTHSTDFHHH